VNTCFHGNLVEAEVVPDAKETEAETPAVELKRHNIYHLYRGTYHITHFSLKRHQTICVFNMSEPHIPCMTTPSLKAFWFWKNVIIAIWFLFWVSL